MIRIVTQILMGLMLFFATATLIPRAVICFRLGKKARGGLYIFLAIAATAFAVMSFGYAYSIFVKGY